MDDLTRMIDRTDQIIKFYVKCPEGKRGRPMNAGRAAEMNKIDPGSVCVKESKEGGRTTFHGMGNKAVHKQASQGLDKRLKEANKGKEKGSLRELKYTNRRLNREANQDYKERRKDPKYKEAIAEMQKGLDAEAAKKTPQASQGTPELKGFKEGPRLMSRSEMGQLVEKVKRIQPTADSMDVMKEAISGLKRGDLINLGNALEVKLTGASSQQDLVDRIVEDTIGFRARANAIQDQIKEKYKTRPYDDWETSFGTKKKESFTPSTQLKPVTRSAPQEDPPDEPMEWTTDFSNFKEGPRLMGRSDMGMLVDKVKKFQPTADDVDAMKEEISDLKRGDLVNLAGILGVGIKNATSQKELVDRIVFDTIGFKAQSNDIKKQIRDEYKTRPYDDWQTTLP